MNTEKMTFNVAPGLGDKVELIIREGEAIKVLDPKAPVKIDITGTIASPFEFLRHRNHIEKLNVYKTEGGETVGERTQTKPGDQFNIKRCHLLVSREDVAMTLIINEDDEYNRGTIVGSLELNPKMLEFGINTSKTWEPNELGQYLKMNRAYFVDRNSNMELVTKLKNFMATVDTKIKKQKEDSGTFEDSYAGVVTSNLPGSFKLNIPLFKGMPKETIEVEFMASVGGRTVLLQLWSPDATATFEDVRDKCIDEQIEKIKALEPGLLIIEK